MTNSLSILEEFDGSGLPSEEDIKLIKVDPHNLQFIKDPCDMLIKYAIDEDATVIKYIPSNKISFNVFEYLMDMDEDNIHLIKKPTPEMMSYYVKRFYDNNAYEMAFFNIFSNKSTKEAWKNKSPKE